MASTAVYNRRYSISNFNFNLTVVKYSFAQASEILPKINVFKQYYVRKQKLVNFRPRVHSDVVVMWCIPPPNSSPSFEVSAIF